MNPKKLKWSKFGDDVLTARFPGFENSNVDGSPPLGYGIARGWYKLPLSCSVRFNGVEIGRSKTLNAGKIIAQDHFNQKVAKMVVD